MEALVWQGRNVVLDPPFKSPFHMGHRGGQWGEPERKGCLSAFTKLERFLSEYISLYVCVFCLVGFSWREGIVVYDERT